MVVEPKKGIERPALGCSRDGAALPSLLAEVHVRSIEFYNRAIGDPEVQKRLA